MQKRDELSSRACARRLAPASLNPTSRTLLIASICRSCRVCPGKLVQLASPRMKREAEEDLGQVTLIPKRASASRVSGVWKDKNYDVLADGRVVGCRLAPALAQPSPACWRASRRPAIGRHTPRLQLRPPPQALPPPRPPAARRAARQSVPNPINARIATCLPSSRAPFDANSPASDIDRHVRPRQPIHKLIRMAPHVLPGNWVNSVVNAAKEALVRELQ
jgi:hypothetical protein